VCCSLVLHTESIKRAREMYSMFTWCLQRVYTVFAACFYRVYFAFHSNFSGSRPCRNILKHNATKNCLSKKTLQHTAAHCLQRVYCMQQVFLGTHCTHCLQFVYCVQQVLREQCIVQHNVTHCNTLQHPLLTTCTRCAASSQGTAGAACGHP